MKVRFKNPPINEVIIGNYFESPLAGFRNEHIGLLWLKFRENFPTVEQRPPIVKTVSSQSSILGNSSEIFPMPRYWFVSEDEVNLLQIQKDAFLLNWRKRDSDYPHFDENLKPSFEKYYGIFEMFIKEVVGMEHLKIGHRELTYIDLIEPSEYWQNPQDTPNLIRSFSIPEWASADGAIPDFNCRYSYNVQSDLQLHVALRTAEAVNQAGSPRLILEFKALGPSNSTVKSDAGEWYDRAHDAIVTQFLNITNKHVQDKLWMFESSQ